MTRGRFPLIILVALIVTLGLGYAWGASGRLAVETALENSHHQLDLADARAALLDARVSLYNNNFGDASRRFEDSKTTLRRMKDWLQNDGRNDAALSIDAALRHVDEAQQLAGKLDPAANSRADDALEALKVASQR